VNPKAGHVHAFEGCGDHAGDHHHGQDEQENCHGLRYGTGLLLLDDDALVEADIHADDGQGHSDEQGQAGGLCPVWRQVGDDREVNKRERGVATKTAAMPVVTRAAVRANLRSIGKAQGSSSRATTASL
jgi:hypothetical protein